MVLGSIAIFIALCFVLWLGTGLIVSSVDRFSRGFSLSPFSLSFFVLGFMTSIPEMAVGDNALAQGTPDVFVGNLLGGIPVIFLLIIPVLAVLGNGVKVNHEISPVNLLITLGVVTAPALFVVDRTVTNLEGWILILLYLALFVLLEDKKGGILSALLAKRKKKKPVRRSRGFVMFKILFGALMVLGSAHFLLELTLYFANLIGVLPFYVSLIVLSVGTNIPELSIAIRSVLQGRKDIALGGYLGSASANALLFGVLTLLSPAESFNVNHSLVTLFFIVGGLALFYYFYRSRHDISRKEGLMLFGLYALFAFLELYR